MPSDTAEAPHAEQSGSLIGGCFRIEASLGQGGMGAVYLVRDERSGKQVALKQLRVDRVGKQALLFAQFEREYHTLAQLAHPRIIEVYDYGVDNGFAFYTMELLDGQDLRERGRLPWAMVCALLRDVASSLAILHSRRLLHRDISARNVRCTRDGRAKLIDFGAMAPMGVAKHIVGTPPFVPPEALQLQALDGRADLYALGSLAYWLLTGRYAYPARSFEQLRDLWRSPPATPRAYDPSIPEALDRLVMELIQLDRAGRPDSAAEVMERLSTIAGLSLDELPEVSAAYLATPTLVGRDAPLQEVRRSLVQAMQSQGGSVLIEAEEGAGRSRFLDAAVLEAKLLGTLVLRGDAGDATADYGLIQALGRQLLRDAPQLGARAARPWRSLLATVFPELERASLPAREKPERRHVQSALRNWFLLAARKKHLVIAVDDVHAVDEPSAALLGALAHGTKRHKLSLLLTAKLGVPQSAALSLLRQIARPLSLPALSQPQTLHLLRSVFGDVEHVTALAERIHELAHGHPRWTMALCERLVERGAARYEAGSWLLPAALSADDLPASLTGLLAARVQALSSDARELALTLSLTDPTAIATSDYAALTGHRDRARTHRAQSELVAAQILIPDGTRHRFAERELLDALQADLTEARTRELHARIAAAIGESDNPALLPRHLLLGGREREGLQLLVTLRDHPRLSYSTMVLELLEIAATRAEALQCDAQLQQELQLWLVTQTALLGDYERFHRHAWPLLDRLLRDSGVHDYLELESAGLDPEARLAAADARCHERHAAALPELRGHAPAVARERLSRLYANIVSMATVCMELAPIERLPSLTPFIPIFPVARIVQMHLEAVRGMVSAHFDVAARTVVQLKQALANSAHELNPVYVKQMSLGCDYMSGLLTAGIGHPRTRLSLKPLEHEPGHRVLAWRAYMIYELMLGHVEAAAECQRRAELLNLQDGGQLIFPGTTAATELIVYSYADDLIGLKRCVERLSGLAERYPGWRPFLDVARAHYLRVQGDHAAALAALEPALRSTAPGRTQAWTLAVPCHVSLLIALGRAAEAVEHGQSYLDDCTRHQLRATSLTLLRAVAEAMLKAGRIEEARRMADDHVTGHRALGTKGLLLGLAYETRARVAIAAQDEAELRTYAELCAAEYKGGHNLTLSAKYQNLMREAEGGGITLTSGIQRAADVEAPATGHTITGRTANSRLLACIGTQERAEEGMRLLLELTGAKHGYLFAVREGRLELAPHLELAPPPPGLRDLLNDYLRRTLESRDEVTSCDTGAPEATPLERWQDEAGNRYEPMLLYGNRGGQQVVTALAALHYDSEARPLLRRDLLEMLADVLADDERSAELDRTSVEIVDPG